MNDLSVRTLQSRVHEILLQVCEQLPSEVKDHIVFSKTVCLHRSALFPPSFVTHPVVPCSIGMIIFTFHPEYSRQSIGIVVIVPSIDPIRLFLVVSTIQSAIPITSIVGPDVTENKTGTQILHNHENNLF